MKTMRAWLAKLFFVWFCHSACKAKLAQSERDKIIKLSQHVDMDEYWITIELVIKAGFLLTFYIAVWGVELIQLDISVECWRQLNQALTSVR